MKYAASALAIAGMAATVRGHGFITSPQARMPGDAFKSACGEQVYYNQEGDNYGNVQGELQVAATQSDYNAAECNVWLCKGFKYADNKDNVQSYSAGEKVAIKFDIRAPHTGTANVSIVDTASNSIIGTPLISWDEYASNSASIPAGQTSFSITIPDDLGSKCSTAGACVIQHWWDAASIDQTYESCIDFTVGGSGSSSSDSSASSGSSSAAASVTTNAAVVASSSSSAAATKAPVTTAAASSAAQATTLATQVSSTSCTSTVTLTRSSAADSSATTGVSAIAELSSAIPSSALTATATAAASATGSAKAIPSGFTLKDCLDWINYIVSEQMASSSQ